MLVVTFFTKQVIIYTSTAKKAEQIKDRLDTLSDSNISINGDTMLIYNNIYSDIKFMSAVTFTTCKDNPQQRLTNNDYFPHILIATASCIGNGLDSDNVYQVIHVGFLLSIVDTVQEMGRCGRNRSNNSDADSISHEDKYTLLINLNNFVYMNKRLYHDINLEEINKQNRAISFFKDR